MDVPKKGVSRGEKARSNSGIRERVGIGRQSLAQCPIGTRQFGSEGGSKGKGGNAGQATTNLNSDSLAQKANVQLALCFQVIPGAPPDRKAPGGSSSGCGGLRGRRQGGQWGEQEEASRAEVGSVTGQRGRVLHTMFSFPPCSPDAWRVNVRHIKASTVERGMRGRCPCVTAA